MSEDFRPVRNSRSSSPLGRVMFAVRLCADLQVATVHAHVKPFLASASGTIVDVGAGDMPYRHLVAPGCRYRPIDTSASNEFDYTNAEVTHFDGTNIPFETDSVDHVLCTEVLEHVPDPSPLVAEVRRVLKPGGTALVTVPWSARCHYMPHDYHRFTPTALGLMFAKFSSVEIRPRGTDVSAIGAKMLVAWARLVLPAPRALALVTWLPALLLAPFVAAGVLAGHAGAWLSLGSRDDPLGYTIRITK
jgi:SAM-dependent methyltransferase